MQERRYDVKFLAYCGMSLPLAQKVDRDQARDCVQQYLRKAKKRQPVTYLGDGQWECQEPEDCALVPDWAGYLIVRRSKR